MKKIFYNYYILTYDQYIPLNKDVKSKNERARIFMASFDKKLSRDDIKDMLLNLDSRIAIVATKTKFHIAFFSTPTDYSEDIEQVLEQRKNNKEIIKLLLFMLKSDPKNKKINMLLLKASSLV